MESSSGYRILAPPSVCSLAVARAGHELLHEEVEAVGAVPGVPPPPLPVLLGEGFPSRVGLAEAGALVLLGGGLGVAGLREAPGVELPLALVEDDVVPPAAEHRALGRELDLRHGLHLRR